MKPRTVEVVICRTCLGECNDFKSIHKQGLMMGEVTTLASMLAFCTNLDIVDKENSSLPSFICLNCFHDVIRSYTFKKKALHAHEILCGNLDSESETIEEKSQAHENVYVLDESETDLQELAEAAQMKREQLQQEEVYNESENNEEEYLQLTVLSTEGDAENLHRNVHHQHENSEEVEMEYIEQEVAETTEIYHTTIISEEMQHLDDNEEIVQDQQQHSEIIGEDDKVEYEIQVNDFEEDYAELITDSQDSMPQQSFKRPVDDTTNSGSESGLFNPSIPKRRRTNSNRPANPDFQCKVCGKQLSNSSSFKYHMKLHSNVTPYKCEVCGEAFKTRNAYDGHMSTHNPNNPNTCKLCGKSYRQPSSLRMHMLTHSGVKPFTCEVCGKSLTQKSGYKKHMLTHTGEKPYSCDICGKSFCISSNMLVHRRSHTDQRQHQCSECDKSFLTSEQLKRHSIIHSSERPFGCGICGKQFKRQSAWRSHLQIHHDKSEKQYDIIYSDEYDDNNQEKSQSVENL